jgi:hypothetical protein
MEEKDAADAQEITRRIKVLDNMPECAEKECRILYWNLRLLALGARFARMSIQAIREALESLPDLFDREEMHLSGARTVVAAILKYLSEDADRHAVTDADAKLKYREAVTDAANQLEQLTSRFCVVDVQELVYLVSKTAEAAETIAHKDIILLLGNTGAGKSTTIHLLAGSQMEKDEGSEHIRPGEVRNPSLRSVKVLNCGESVTRYITAVPITFEIDNEEKSLILCDTPGFQDTMGAEVDIANCIGLVSAIRGANSVRPVVLISYRDGNRLQGVSVVASTIANMVNDVRRNKLPELQGLH